MSTQTSKRLGVDTSPLSLALPEPQDLKLTKDLVECLERHDMFDTKEDREHRILVLVKLNELVKSWIYQMSIKKGKTETEAKEVGGNIFTFGSYRLGVHGKGSYIDTLAVAPRHVDRNDFFSSFIEVLTKHKGVSHFRAIPEARVPVIKLKFEGVGLFIAFVCLAQPYVTHILDTRDVSLLKKLDRKGVLSLSSLSVTEAILNLIPNKDMFMSALRAIKLWAKNRGIYSSKLGYLGGVSWTILVARTCQLYPNAAASTIVQMFFKLFEQWDWCNPVLLKRLDEDVLGLNLPVWDPRINPRDAEHLMFIITPVYPQSNTAFSVTTSARSIVIKELKRGMEVCEGIVNGKKSWDDLFETLAFFTLFKHYIMICVKASSEQQLEERSGLVESSKIRSLVGVLEKNGSIELAHVYTESYGAMPSDSTKHLRRWFIGLDFKESGGEVLNVTLTDEIGMFKMQVMVESKLRSSNLMEDTDIEVKHVKRKDLHTYLPTSVLPSVKKRKSRLNASASKSNGGISDNLEVKGESCVNEAEWVTSKRPGSQLDEPSTKKPRHLDDSGLESSSGPVEHTVSNGAFVILPPEQGGLPEQGGSPEQKGSPEQEGSPLSRGRHFSKECGQQGLEKVFQQARPGH